MDMDDKNELSDIVLNKGNSANSNKKLIMAVAILGVVLIIVIVIMNSMSTKTTNNLPHQAALPPKPQEKVVKETHEEEPLFEDVEIMEDDTSPDADLDKIAQKLKQESVKEDTAPVKREPSVTKSTQKSLKAHTQKKAIAKKTTPTTKHAVTESGKFYIQVGSFSKYKPNKKFLGSIEKLGFHYKFHKTGKVQKVLVGPFKTRKDANKAKKVLRTNVEPGAFVVTL